MKKIQPLAVVIAGSYDEEEDQLLKSSGINVKILGDEINDSTIRELKIADALILGVSGISAKLIAEAPYLKIIARHGVGYDNVDIQAAADAGIYVTNTPGTNSQTVAEFTFGVMLSLTRHIHDSWLFLRSGGWRKPIFWGSELTGMNLGIIGLGNIGRQVARLGKAFGMKVSAFDPYVPHSICEKEGASPSDLNGLLSSSDIISIHCSLTEGTRNLLGKKEFSMMKGGAYLINMARGEIVRNEELLNALEKGRLSGVAVDVFDLEPPADRRLVEHPLVLATPHIASWGIQAKRKMCVEAGKQVVMTLNGEQPLHAVNKPQLPRNLQK